MNNAYYQDMRDPLWEKYTEDSNKEQKKFFEEARNYTLQMYSCTLTDFIRTHCIYHPYDQDEYWMEISASEDPKKIIDDIFYEYQRWRQQACINGSLLIP
jgi:hypothetical protein